MREVNDASNRGAPCRALVIAAQVAVVVVSLHQAALADEAMKSSGEQPNSMRISPSQYKQSLSYIFGSSIKVAGRFDPETRDQGLLAIGARRANISDTAFERYDDLARGIAAQVTDTNHRLTLVPCRPNSAAAADDACARKFIARTGRLLFRRPMTEDEIGAQVRLARESTITVGDFYAGLAFSLETMLVSPNFLFRYVFFEEDPAHSGELRMESYSKATQLSFLLWNAGPDDELVRAATAGELQTREGLLRQVDRMTASPRLEAGIRAFFSDMFGFNEYATLSKDAQFFPHFTMQAKEDTQEQTLRTVVDHLLVRQGDYRDLFTSPNTFLTRSLAALYRVPLAEMTDNGQPQHWQPYTYADGDPRAGLLSQASFVALHSPSGRTSPTLRGKALREYILCQTVPPPPGNVDFKFVQDTSNPLYKTTRARLTAHRSEAMCAGCHKITDPMGLALENFDAAGGYRMTENGAPIDASGDLNGVKFVGSLGLGKALHDEPAATACVAKRAFAFGAGRLPSTNDPRWNQVELTFKDSKYNFVALLRTIASSDLFYLVPGQAVVTAKTN